MRHWAAAIEKAFPAELNTYTVKDKEGQCKQHTLSVLSSVDSQTGDQLKKKKTYGVLGKCWDRPSTVCITVPEGGAQVFKKITFSIHHQSIP